MTINEFLHRLQGMKGGGGPVMTAAEYMDISADAIAAYLVKACGVDAIFGGDNG